MAPKGTPVVVNMDNPSYSVVEIDDPDAAFKPMEKTRGKNPKQVTWVLLLKAHRAVGRAAWIATLFWDLLGTIKRRLIFRQEVVAYFKGWHCFQNPSLHIPSDDDIQGLLHLVYVTWLPFRADYIAPLIQALSKFCIALFLVQSEDRFMLSLGCFWIKYKKIKPKIEGDPFESVDVEECSYEYPMGLVQIPMCNEREVYEQSISAVCQLDWPKDRLLIQVLDEVATWSQRGINIIYCHRLERTGYKAGNLKSAMSCEYVKAYDLKFLKRTVPHFKDNPELRLVQARWAFVNKDENLLTRLQNINLCFHFEVEQQVNGVFLNFFGFNGTAGVWRIKALEESGGWLERTTVEDMDIAIRAHLNVVCLSVRVLSVLCEVPESYEAYRKQQHRWHSGPMQLFRLCLPAILTSKIAIWKKANLILLFFLLRKLILPFYSFTLFCIILPLTMFVPEAELPVWVICYVPVFMSFLNILPSPKSFPFIVPYLLFENTMSVTKFNAMVSGLFQLGSSYEWVAGRSSESDLVAATKRESKITNQQHIPRGASQSEFTEYNELKEQKEAAPIWIKKVNKIYRKELTLAFLLLAASVRSLLLAQGVHFYFLLFQGVTFLLVGLDLIGEQMS
ncbi:hypothetical protein ES319_A06G113200v1 [Gossypium barbadense]|uniref:Glycosyltransferase 2-like domain-containing protein n=1 Tax=Gossypium barbadense TaxID=3634 RepID=A0A5J5VCU2_GOSBA|nr:hypothetical protein ES319_A06G113200v1 [Gossypium barbadense]